MEAKVKKNDVKRLFKEILIGNRIKIAIVFLCVFVTSAINAIGSVFFKFLVDDYITPLIGVENPNFKSALSFIMMMGLIYLMGIIATFIYEIIMVKVSESVMRRFREKMFAHMQTLDIAYFDTNKFGEIMSVYTNDVEAIREMIARGIPQILVSITSVIATTIAMFIINVPLTIFVLSTTFFLLIILFFIGKKSTSLFSKQQTSLAKVNGYVEEMVNGQKEIKVFSHEQVNLENFDIVNNQLKDDIRKANNIANNIMPVMANLTNIQFVLVSFFGGVIAIQRPQVGITIGVLIAFLQLTRGFMRPINLLAVQANSLALAFAGAGRIFSMLDQISEEDRGDVRLVYAKLENDRLVKSDTKTDIKAWEYKDKDGNLCYKRNEGKIEFKDVTFGYNEDKKVLSKITLYANPGQKVALIGSTGAGKTTITNLINRFYKINGGEILYDDIDITRIKKSDLRKSIGVVLQETNLFSGSVMENIRYGRLDASDEECIEAAKLVNAHDFITSLPHGYQTIISGSNSNLSQGQMQLISIVRAAVANPSLMILDEATSSVDTRTEQLLQGGMDELMKDRTVLVIAHRLSTIQNSNVIMVLEAGEIIERGSHQKLIDTKGKYYSLYTGSFDFG